MNKAINAKLLAISKDLGWVEKRGHNDFSNYDYVQAVDIFAGVREALYNHGVVFSFSQDEANVTYPGDSAQVRDVLVKGTYVFSDVDTDEAITGDWFGFASDKGDKSLWKALTGALKYVFISNFLLPSGDDPENEKAEKPARAEAVSSAPVPPKAATAGLSEKQRGLFMARLEEKGLKSAGQRKAFLVLLLQKQSTKQMTSEDLDKALAELDDAESVIVDNAKAVV